ncbi:MAG: hypothetical protein HWD92_09145 [Flavobacteriia bacterium]|nr:hypothetical protein [Flavobacteriia bacterium]
MVELWTAYREYESLDLVKKLYQSKHGRDLSTTKALKITSSFMQGRNYMEAAENSDYSIRPLLLYYGIQSMSRGLILFLSTEKADIRSSHGLALGNIQERAANNSLTDLTFRISNGTFKELVESTRNRTYFYENQSTINCHIDYDKLPDDYQFTLNEVLCGVPVLKPFVHAWLNSEPDCFQVLRIDGPNPQDEHKRISYSVKGNLNDATIERLGFVEYERHFNDNPSGRQITMITSPEVKRIVSHRPGNQFGFQLRFIASARQNEATINDISCAYALSHFLSTLCRYHPTVWMGILMGREHNSLYPTAYRAIEFIESNYLRMLLEHLEPNNF